MYKTTRAIYAVLFFVLLLIEVGIAWFLKTGFIRFYVGDVLITLLICAFVKAIFPSSKRWMPLCVFGFSAAVEIMQYFDFVKLFHLQNNAVFSILLGRTFSVGDLVCYAMGCALFVAFDSAIKKRLC